MPTTEPYRIESHIDEDGEPWVDCGTHATQEAAQEKLDVLAEQSYRLDFRIINTETEEVVVWLPGPRLTKVHAEEREELARVLSRLDANPDVDDAPEAP